MTTEARRVLGDCEAALEMLEDERDEQRWRVLWAGAVALVRTVGHVLHKVDGRHGGARVAINTAYETWKAEGPEHRIFREFIEEERSNILKEYRFSVLDSAETYVAVIARDSDGPSIADESPYVLDENLYRPVTLGFGVGEDARDVYRDAIKWWDAELSRLEAILNQPDQIV